MAKIILKDKNIEPIVIENNRAQRISQRWQENPESTNTVNLGEGKPTFQFNQIKVVIPDAVEKQEVKSIYTDKDFIKVDEELSAMDIAAKDKYFRWLEKYNAIRILNWETKSFAVRENYPVMDTLYREYSKWKSAKEFGEKKRLEQLAAMEPKTF